MYGAGGADAVYERRGHTVAQDTKTPVSVWG